MQKMKSKTKKRDEGVAGLMILLSLVTLLFVIGLLVMIFSLMGGEIEGETYDSTSVSFNNIASGSACGNSTGCYVNSYIPNSAGGIYRSLGSFSVINCTLNNCTLASCEVGTGNYTISSNGFIDGSTANDYYTNVTWNCSGSFSYERDSTASGVINDTTTSISGVTDWFAIFIVIGAMVVLVLLTVIIITAIRSSGLVGGSGQQGGNQNIGSA